MAIVDAFGVDIEQELQRTQAALALEIRANPDKSWRDTLIVRYRSLLQARGIGCDDLRPLEEWRETPIRCGPNRRTIRICSCIGRAAFAR